MSEKFDGVRAYWNGSAMMSRHGKTIPCPDWFLDGLPKDITLDGELWMGRGTFEILNATLNAPHNSKWKQISLIIFDMPSSKKPYIVRMEELTKFKLPSHVHLVDVEICKGNNHLHERLIEIMKHGGEGLMINNPNSFYIAQRTDALLKVKVFLNAKGIL
jgi:DNA ligase-1